MPVVILDEFRHLSYNAARTASRAALSRQAQKMLKRGESVSEVAKELGVREKTVRNYVNDPDASKAAERKRGYRGKCVACGAPTSGGDGPDRARTRCQACAPIARCQWSREAIVTAMLRWQRDFGELPSSTDWSSTFAHRRGGEALRRWELGCWPSQSVVTRRFGGWAQALDEATRARSAAA